MAPLRMAQIGVKHGHAVGKARSMIENPDVEFTGLFEPDPVAREQAQRGGHYGNIQWHDRLDDALGDPSVTAVSIEGRNDESLGQAQAAIEAGKHLWYDKPAGDDWPGFQRLMADAQARGLLVQMGYMFRYQPGFQQVAEWARSGLLGDVFSVRAHMSTWISVPAREIISRHQGGIFYDLAGHMIDQVVWILGRPRRVTTFFRNDATPEIPAFMDNTLGVLEYERGMAVIDIAAMEPRPMARRFEVYGTRGSAITEPFDPGHTIRLTLEEATGGHQKGAQIIQLPEVNRQQMYDRELAAFVATLRGEQPPDRSPEHELMVQETLLRATRGLD